MSRMLGRTKRPRTCAYGARCCTEWHTPHSGKTKRVRQGRRRERRAWEKEARNG